jgi:hypothetical protein
MRVFVLMVVRVVVACMVVVVCMLLRRFYGARSRLLFGSLRGRFRGLLGLLFSDCQWVAFRVLSGENCKLLV